MPRDEQVTRSVAEEEQRSLLGTMENSRRTSAQVAEAEKEKQRKIEQQHYIADWTAAQLKASAEHEEKYQAWKEGKGPKPPKFDMFAVQPEHIPGVSKWSKDFLRGGRRRHTRRGRKHRSTRRR